MSRRARFRTALAVFGLLLAGRLPALGEEPAADAALFDSLQQSVQKLFEKCRGAIARIEATDEHGQLAGTGFFIDPSGLLYTSYTVGGDTRDIVVVVGDLKYSARRLAADEHSGIALLKVEATTPFLPLGSSQALAIGSPVTTIGFPMDLPLSPSFGIIAGRDLMYLNRYFVTTHLRANLAVQRGEGGAPLLNMKGEVVGILISCLDQAGGGSFALPIEAAEKVHKDYVRFGEVRPGWLGISVIVAPEAHAGSTAMIRDIFSGGPAEKAGLKPADVLLAVGPHPIAAPEDMLDACFFLSAEEPVNVSVFRNGEAVSVQVETADYPKVRVAPRALTLGPGGTNLPGSPETPLKIGEE